jgi:hypothetical protein
MVEEYVRILVLSTKETDAPIIPESENGFGLNDRSPFLSVRQIDEKS